jgi:molecular chaperone GrpE
MLRQKSEDDSIESGTVLQVLENGYRIGDRTIRHAKVIVSE